MYADLILARIPTDTHRLIKASNDDRELLLFFMITKTLQSVEAQASAIAKNRELINDLKKYL